MKTKEFIKKVKELGYETFEGVNKLYIRVNGITLGFVGLKKMYYMNLEVELKGLFDLCVDYVKTPIEEREEEKKYYLRLKDDFYKITSAYLTRDIRNGDYFSFGKHELKDTQNKFTQKEIDEIKKKFNTDLEEFRQVEVEE